MSRRVIVALLLAVPMLVAAATREPSQTVPLNVPPPEPNRGQAWIQYDDGGWDYTWTGGGYMGNMFFPRYATWYPFQVEKVQYLYGNVGGGIINRIRVFDGGPAVVAEWASLAGASDVWATVTAATPPVISSGPFYVAGWMTTGDDSPSQGTVDATLWPGTYWPVSNVEPFIFLDGPTTSAATAGWAATTGPGSQYTTTSVASFRVLVSGNTVPVELCALEGKARPGYVVISWTTASELDNIGFNVYRSDAENGQYAKMNDGIIAGQGTTATEHAYTFADYGVQPGSTYYYKVEDVSADGTTSLHGPIAVPLGSDFVSSWGAIKAQFNQ